MRYLRALGTGGGATGLALLRLLSACTGAREPSPPAPSIADRNRTVETWGCFMEHNEFGDDPEAAAQLERQLKANCQGAS